MFLHQNDIGKFKLSKQKIEKCSSYFSLKCTGCSGAWCGSRWNSHLDNIQALLKIGENE